MLLDPTDKRAGAGKDVQVFVSLNRHTHTKKYGRSRRKVFWEIYVETKAGRGIWSLAIQLLIPLKAFERFPEIIVVADPERTFLHPKNYQSFILGELENWFGADEAKKIGSRGDRRVVKDRTDYGYNSGRITARTRVRRGAGESV